MEARNQAFQQLKPICVKVSESALKLMGSSGNVQDVSNQLLQLLRVLRPFSGSKNVIDSKLAEYIFFPLSNVLKQLEKLPTLARERTFDCIHILLQTAWSRNINPELGIQLLILYTFVLDQAGTKASEELQSIVFKSLSLLLASLGAEAPGQDALVRTSMMPHLGKAVSTMLDAIADSGSEEVQVSALAALDAFCHAVPDRDALGSSFLPGIMSCFSKVMPQKSSKSTSKSLAAAIEILTFLLPHLFKDEIVKQYPGGELESGGMDTGLNQKWLRATTPQMKIALSNILKLQQHDRQIVRLALGRLCLALLTGCGTSLTESVPMLLEASLTLATQEDVIQTELAHILLIRNSFAESLQSSLHYWIVSLPRLMASADESKKHRRIQQIEISLELLNERGLDMSVLQKDLASNLRDSVTTAVKDVGKLQIRSVTNGATAPLDLIQGTTSAAPTFDLIISPRKSQVDVIKDLERMAVRISISDHELDTAQALFNFVHTTQGDMQISSFWLVLTMLRNALSSEQNVDAFLTFSDTSPDRKTDLLEQMYDFAISTLTETSLSSPPDWRIQALALEVIALQASQLKEAFRPELVDALYPVLHQMGATEPALQQHATTCLTMLASYCGYGSPGELIVANVDYLVNAVAMRLNTYDISPQAPQVLYMMVKLAGPPLLPHLDDTIDSVFQALEAFHGYPKLVDLLFRVLRAIVEEGARSPQLAITSGNSVSEIRSDANSFTMDQVLEQIKTAKAKDEHKETTDEADTKTPQAPWGSTEKQQSDIHRSRDQENSDSGPPTPRVYSLLLNISRLTQHYLPSSSAELRTSLLGLLSMSLPALANHENSFLPVIHTLWPVIIPRLDDPEPYVVADSLNIIGLMCKHAGDFMRGRIEEVWPTLTRLHRTRIGRTRAAVSESQGHFDVSLDLDMSKIVTTVGAAQASTVAPHYVDAPSRIIWNSFVDMLMKVITFTATSDRIFDEALELLEPILPSREDVRQALESRNADAVWLALLRLDSSRRNTSNIDQKLVPQAIRAVTSSRWQFAVA